MRRVLIALTFSLLGCATPSAAAAQTPTAPAAPAPARTERFTLEQMLGLSYAGRFSTSPDGAWVAYELYVPRAADEDAGHMHTEIWVVPRAGGEPRRFTSKPVDATTPRWSPDSKTLAFLSKREAYHKQKQVFAVPLGGGEAALLTRSETDVSDFEWSPDGKRIAFRAADADTEAIKAEQKAGKDWNVADVHRRHQRLWLVDVATGENRRLVGDAHVQAFEWSPQGDRLLASVSASPDPDSEFMASQLYTVSAASGERTQLTKRESKMGDSSGMAWSPSGGQIAFTWGVDGEDPFPGSIFVMPAGGGEPRNLTPSYLATVLWIDWLDERTIVFAAIEGTRTTLNRLVVASGAITPIGSGAQGGPICYGTRLAADRRTLACVGYTAERPWEIYAGQIGKGAGVQLTRLTPLNPALSKIRFAQQQPIRWKSGDGLEIEGVLIEPLDRRPGQRYPLVVTVHGGPEGWMDNGWHNIGQLLAARGMAVLYPNYRGSCGRGVAFSKADHKDLGGKEFDDVLTGIDHLDRLGLIDPKRVGITGWSYGGYLTALASTRHSERFAAGVMGAGISNWISFTGTTDIPKEMSIVHWALWPFDDPKLAWERSPVAHIAKAKTPMLILHGENDPRVPVGQAWEMYRGLKHVHVETELVTYPREGHSIEETAHSADLVRRTLGWFERHLQQKQ